MFHSSFKRKAKLALYTRTIVTPVQSGCSVPFTRGDMYGFDRLNDINNEIVVSVPASCLVNRKTNRIAGIGHFRSVLAIF